jgi:hypothetical protein
MVIISVTYAGGGNYHLIMITIVTGTSIKLEINIFLIIMRE